MMRALLAAFALFLAAPASATEQPSGTTLAQEQQKQQPVQKRDCERSKPAEGVS